MALTPDANGNIPVAGLLVPATLVGRIDAAIRGLYPELAAGKGTEAAIKAWLKFNVTSLLAIWEPRVAKQPVEEALEATRVSYQQKAEAARLKAETDAATITEQPPVPPPPPPVTP